MELERIYELDGGFKGDVIGFFGKGHIEANLFYSVAVCEYQYLQEELLEIGDIEEEDMNRAFFPFNTQDVSHKYMRYPTDAELETDGYESNEEFILSDSKQHNMEPITLVYI